MKDTVPVRMMILLTEITVVDGVIKHNHGGGYECKTIN